MGHLAPMLLMAYGLLPVSEIRKLGWRIEPPAEGPRGRPSRDDRRSGSSRSSISCSTTSVTSAWRVVRPLVREGTCRDRIDPRTRSRCSRRRATRRPRLLIADDPGLLDVEAWRLFEVEGGGEDSLANHEKFFGDTWGDVFRDLAARDPADARSGCSTSSLAALARDFSTYRAGWFSRFHESLAPTDDERAQRADAYLGLLRSRVGPTVSMAIAALVRIDRAGRLPADDLLDRISPVLGDGPAGTAKAALGLVGRAGTGSADRGRQAAIVAAAALAHPSADVQRASIVLIGRLVDGPDARCRTCGRRPCARGRCIGALGRRRLGGAPGRQ